MCRKTWAARVKDEGLSDIFHLFGPTIDIQQIYERIDVIAFPSHFDYRGRPVFVLRFPLFPPIVGS